MSTVPFYPMADTFMIDLHEKTSGLLIGHKQELLELGDGLEFKTDLMLESECRYEATGSALVKIRKSVWAYMVYLGVERQLYMAIFDGPGAGMKTTDFQKGLTGKIVDTWETIRPHVKAVFKSRSVDGWSSCEVDNLDKGLALEGVAGDPAGAEPTDDQA